MKTFLRSKGIIIMAAVIGGVMGEGIESQGKDVIKMSDYFVYVGAYTGPENPGITQFVLDGKSGALKLEGNVAETTNPSYLTVSSKKDFLYATNEISGGKLGAVNGYKIDKNSGKLKFLGSVEAGGSGPCYVAVDRDNHLAVVGNYGTGSTAAIALREDGAPDRLTTSVQHHGRGKDPQRQTRAHTHCAVFDPSEKFVLAADLGTDKVFVYKVNEKQEIVPNEIPYFSAVPGSGPRHVKFHPKLPVVYISNELDSTLTVFRWDGEKGVLSDAQTTTTLPGDFSGGNTVAEVLVDSSGRYVYVSNRGHNSVAKFGVDEKTGAVELLEFTSTEGDFPRGMALSPDGRWAVVANQKSDNVLVFSVDKDSGKLVRVGEPMKVSKPVSIVFVEKTDG